MRDHTTKLRFLGLDESGIKCIKSDWLLLSPNNPGGLFLFNPFTQEVVDIPAVPTESASLVFAFCRASKSGHFVVYSVMRPMKPASKISIFKWESCGRRDREWKWDRSIIAPKFPGMDWIFKAECVGDDLYCIFGTGAVGVFNRVEKSWTAIVRSSDEYLELFGLSGHGTRPLLLPPGQVIELRGELFVMNCSENCWTVLRLDRSGGAWVKAARLRKCALFFSGFMDRLVMCRAGSDPTRSYYCRDCVSGVACLEFCDDDVDGSDGGDRPWRRVDDLEGIELPWRHGEPPFTNRYFDHWVGPPTL